MNKKKEFSLLNCLVNKNIKLCLKMIDGDNDLLLYLEKREMRKGLKYCSVKRCLIYDAVMKRDAILIKRHLRIPVEAFQKLVELYPSKHHGYDPQMELSITLYWLAAGTSYRVVTTAFNVPLTTVFNIVQRTLDMLLSLMKQIIQLPTENQLHDEGMKFANRAGSDVFKKAVGAIDGTHIKIKCPTMRHDEYINRKLDYSIQLQAICNADHKFIHICVGWPGSVHDQRVLRNSDIYLNRKYPPPDYYLLGDSGYQLTLDPIAIITPFTENRSLTNQQKQFNYLHSKARIAIEQAFGQMKTRWRCIFLRSLEISIKNSTTVIAVCCMLHNICLDVGDLMVIESKFQPQNSVPPVKSSYQPQIGAAEYRNILCSEI